MREIEVDTDGLRTQIAQLEEKLQLTREELIRLTDSVDALQSMWNGPAHDEFNKQYELDRERMEQMCTIIQNVLEGMQNARAEYDRCEGDVGSLVAGMQV